MIRNLKLVEKFLAFCFLFLLPTQLALHLWPTWAFVFGLRVDLLAPAVYLTDIVIVCLFLIKIIERNDFFETVTKYKTFLLILIVFSVLNSIFSTSPMESIYKWVKLFELIFVSYYFIKQKAIEFSVCIKTLFYSTIAFSIIGIAQFLKGGTIGGVLYYLGERTFSLSTPGIALVSLNGAEHLRSYSTFSHPNSLAGFLGTAILLILLSGQLRKNLPNAIGVLVVMVAFSLTFSVSAYIGIFLVFAFYLFSKNWQPFKILIPLTVLCFVVISLLLPIFSPWLIKAFPQISQNIGQRLDLAYIAGKMVSQRFWFGEGLGTFIVNIPEYKGIFSYSWLLQPVHNIFLLIFAELGIFGIVSFCLLIYKFIIIQLTAKRTYFLLPIIFVLFTGLFDHYTLTLQQNMLLLSLLIGLGLR